MDFEFYSEFLGYIYQLKTFAEKLLEGKLLENREFCY